MQTLSSACIIYIGKNRHCRPGPLSGRQQRALRRRRRRLVASGQQAGKIEFSNFNSTLLCLFFVAPCYLLLLLRLLPRFQKSTFFSPLNSLQLGDKTPLHFGAFFRAKNLFICRIFRSSSSSLLLSSLPWPRQTADFCTLAQGGSSPGAAPNWRRSSRATNKDRQRARKPLALLHLALAA